MANTKLEYTHKYLTAPYVQQKLGLSRFQMDRRIKKGILPAPTFIDPDTSIWYLDEQWLRTAKAILDNAIQVRSL